jgi:hypothetical protein
MRPNAKINTLAYVITAVILTIFVATPAFGGNLPSSKAAAASGYLTALGKACSDEVPVPGAPEGPGECVGSSGTDTGWVTVQRTYIKTPNAKDLVMNVAMQTGLVTFTEVKSKGGNKDTSKAQASIQVRVVIYDVDSSTLEVIPTSHRYAYPSSDNGVNDGSGVTYNSRTQVLSATFQGIIERCISDVGTIFIDDQCLDPEEVSLLLETLSANAFNFIAANEGPGIKQIDVQARAKATTDLFGGTGSAKGEAYVGLGSMLIETVRFVKDQDGVPEIQELQ